MVDLACNYEPTANLDDASCEFGNCPGCNDSGAENYNPTSTNDEICEYSFTFTNCGQEGRFGPSIEQANQEYGAASLTTVIDGIQQYIVPESGTYSIEAFGARGGNGDEDGFLSGGYGATMVGYFELQEADVLRIVVGQTGQDNQGGGGGGGSFVWNSNMTLYIAAGGGGGAGDLDQSSYGEGMSGVVTQEGTSSSGGSSNGGTEGSGGYSYDADYGGGAGAGWSSKGEDGVSGTGGYSLSGGFKGGSNDFQANIWGGFGGGGANGESGAEGGGGGGGYSGGGGGDGDMDDGGGGGGSFISEDATLISSESGVNEGHGKVVITLIPSP
jgi:hypothetical protein